MKNIQNPAMIFLKGSLLTAESQNRNETPKYCISRETGENQIGDINI